jgi:hypothetical protein
MDHAATKTVRVPRGSGPRDYNASLSDLAVWWSVTMDQARKVSRRRDFPRKAYGEEWSVSQVEAWLAERDYELPVTEGDELNLRLWDATWEDLSRWQKPVQATVVAARSVKLGIYTVIALIALLLIAAVAVVYLYHLLTNQP